MAFIKTYLITAAIGLAVAGGVSALSLHANVNRGNGGEPHHVLAAPATEPQPGYPTLYGSNLSVSAEPAVHTDER